MALQVEINNGKKFYKKQFYLPDGRRATIRFGTMSVKAELDRQQRQGIKGDIQVFERRI